MINDEGEIVDLYIPRKWCVPCGEGLQRAGRPPDRERPRAAAAIARTRAPPPLASSPSRRYRSRQARPRRRSTEIVGQGGRRCADFRRPALETPHASRSAAPAPDRTLRPRSRRRSHPARAH